MKRNPPIPGHELIADGHVKILYDDRGEETDVKGGGCRCGAKPPGWPDLSIRAVRNWHRQHKDEIRGAGQ